jgi:prepilin peptidase CpaA
MLLTYFCFAAFAALLGLAAFSDVRERRIPNRLTAGLLLLYPIYVVTSPVPVAWPAAVWLAFVVFVIGFGLFARELIGGGDVKLLAVLSLWAGSEQFVSFMLITGLAGGALSLFTLLYRRWGFLVEAHLAALGLAATTGRSSGLPDAPTGAPDQSNTLPYGVAIAVRGIAIIVELANL